MKFKSMKTRILIWFGSIVTVLLLLFSVGFYYFFNQNAMASVQSKLYKHALYIEEEIEANTPIDTILRDKSLSDLDVAVLKYAHIIHQTRHFNLQNIDKYTKKHTTFLTSNNADKLQAVLALKFKKPFSGVIILVQDEVAEKVEDVVDTMLVLNPILLFLMIFFASRLIDKILIPIKEITKTAQNINIDKLSLQITQPKYNDELKTLIDAFNDMTIRLHAGYEQIERFNSDVSHELKTPLTVIKGEISLALRRPREPQEYQKSLKIISYEANQMQDMVDDLLLLVQYSKENVAQTFSDTDIDVILLSVLEKYDGVLKEKNITLHLEKFEPIQYKGNSQLITIIFSNLIDNAIKYTPENHPIYVSLFKENKIYFIVRDEGIGIKADKIDKITNRFYRVDESRNKEIKGVGLGLSIVKNSVELHNGILNIESKEGIGTKVEVVL